MTDGLSRAIAVLGTGALDEAALARHIFPLFSVALSSRDIYLANHSLGRPLDQTARDVQEACEAWQTKLDGAWDAWLDEHACHRARLAQLIGAARPDCIVPKTSAGQGLRAAVNALPGIPRVLTTRGEFDSVDLILKQYAALGRITLRFVDPAQLFNPADADLVVVSQVMFVTGEIIHRLDDLATACHAEGARLLVDAYHAIGVVPVDVSVMGADFVIGGSYKYLRGGPGACFLYISPATLDSGLAPVDTGWFAKDHPFRYDRPDPPRFARGGDAFLESTPPVLTYYQARAGQRFTLALGVDRIRAYTLDRLTRLKSYLAASGVTAEGGDADHGAFLTVRDPDATGLATRLAERGVRTDARGQWLRLAPDCLTRDDELRVAADTVAAVIHGR